MAHRGIYPNSKKKPSGADVDHFLSNMKMASISDQSLPMPVAVPPSDVYRLYGTAEATNLGFPLLPQASHISNKPHGHEMRPRYSFQPDTIRGSIPCPVGAANSPRNHAPSPYRYPSAPQNRTSQRFMGSPVQPAPSPTAGSMKGPPMNSNSNQTFYSSQIRPPFDNICRGPSQSSTFQPWSTCTQHGSPPMNALPVVRQESSPTIGSMKGPHVPTLNPNRSFNSSQIRPRFDNFCQGPSENNSFQPWSTNTQHVNSPNTLGMHRHGSDLVLVDNVSIESRTHGHGPFDRKPPANFQQCTQQGQPRLATMPYNQPNKTFPLMHDATANLHNTHVKPDDLHQGNLSGSEVYPNSPSIMMRKEEQGVNMTSFKSSWQSESTASNKCPEETDERRSDQNWVDRWLQSLGRMKSSQPQKSTVSIADYKMCLEEALKLKCELQSLGAGLSENMGTEEFQEKMRYISNTRARLEGLNRKLTDAATLGKVQRLLLKRKAKRGRLKRQRQTLYQDKQAELARRSQLHKEMDAVQARLLQQSLQEKQDKEMKAAADKILGEVRRKLSETGKTVELINSLRKLRQLRLKTKGMYLGMEADNMLETGTDSLLSLLTDRKKTYEAEEKTLKVMLETEQEEEREREQARLREREARRTRQEHALYTQRLFGKEDQLSAADPLFPYRQFYRQAEGSLEALIAVRHGWDVYLVAEGTPGSSKIPPDWVLPQQPSSSVWSQVLKQ